MRQIKKALEELKASIRKTRESEHVHEKIDEALGSDDYDKMQEALDSFDMLETNVIQRIRRDDDLRNS